MSQKTQIFRFFGDGYGDETGTNVLLMVGRDYNPDRVQNPVRVEQVNY